MKLYRTLTIENRNRKYTTQPFNNVAHCAQL